ncbi:MAG: leucyl aminopeptidase [Pseudomonadota bacterium]
MADALNVTFAPATLPKNGVLVILADEKMSLSAHGAALEKKASRLIKHAAAATKFTGKRGSALNLMMPRGLRLEQLIVFGAGKIHDMTMTDWVNLGGKCASKLNEYGVAQASVLLEASTADIASDQAAAFALGARLACYRFESFKTKTRGKENARSLKKLVVMVDDPLEAKKFGGSFSAVAEGVELARELINLPPNILGPIEFADECAKLSKLGVKVTVLNEKDMSKLGMGALLGVGQGSAATRGSRLAIMEWNGGTKGKKPIGFVGKGVVFDTGGISIKPGASMEDMKGDMGGAACVTGLMHTLAKRKAKANVIGIVGLVENMPDGNAQRPGDIVTSMSGQTIEIVNTDAEGRLVLADALWYCQSRYKPELMIDLATLTGAVMVALGQDYAGLFSNNEQLTQRLVASGKATGEKVWPMPLGDEYDKIINSKFADMVNSGGRYGGAITAAQFLQRFVNKVPWAHLDIAGVAFGTKASDISKTWNAGFGVRLLNDFVAEHYEH